MIKRKSLIIAFVIVLSVVSCTITYQLNTTTKNIKRNKKVEVEIFGKDSLKHDNLSPVDLE